jgi:hypothetical protein
MDQVWGCAVAAAIAIGAVVPTLAAQDANTCHVEMVKAGGGRHMELGPGRVHQFLWGGVHARCIGQETEMWADSVALYSELDRYDFVGAVRFRDSTMELMAPRASYFPSDERLEAYDNVRLTNRRTGSVLRGPRLTYYRSVPGRRDTTELLATGRPSVAYRPAGDSMAAPYVIEADRIRMRGDDLAWAVGTVRITRSDFRAQGDSAELRFGAGEGALVGDAVASGGDSTGYTIRGLHLDFRLAGDHLRWVQAERRAEATSAEWRVVGDTIAFDLANDRVQAGAAWGDSTRAQAFSARNTLTADSLAIDAPNQVLTEVRAFGRARVVTSGDSVPADADWVIGDTVVARFDSSASGARQLRWLRSVGKAAALYHVYADSSRTGPPAINYARGQQVTAWFSENALDRVEFVGAADGVYLEPGGGSRR